MAEPSDKSRSRFSFGGETVDRWQVFGGVASVVALGITVLGAVKDLVVLSLVVSVVVVLGGVLLVHRWGSGAGERTARAFVVAVVVTLVGAVTAGIAIGISVGSAAGGSVKSSVPKSSVVGDSGESWRGSLTITAGQYLDLDAGDAEKGLQDVFTAGADIKYDEDVLGMRSGAHVALVSASATYQDCAGATALVGNVPGEDVKDGLVFCVETTEGRWARVTVVHKRISEKPENSQVDAEVLVWSGR